VEVSGAFHAAAFYLWGKVVGTHLTGGQVGPTVGMDAIARRKIYNLTEIETLFLKLLIL
jgi:hypothetical protein